MTDKKWRDGRRYREPTSVEKSPATRSASIEEDAREIARSSGVSEDVSREFLLALRDGQSKEDLIRAIDEAARMVEDMTPAELAELGRELDAADAMEEEGSK
jgi:hypothetical protein